MEPDRKGDLSLGIYCSPFSLNPLKIKFGSSSYSKPIPLSHVRGKGVFVWSSLHPYQKERVLFPPIESHRQDINWALPKYKWQGDNTNREFNAGDPNENRLLAVAKIAATKPIVLQE